MADPIRTRTSQKTCPKCGKPLTMRLRGFTGFGQPEPGPNDWRVEAEYCTNDFCSLKGQGLS